MDMVLVGLVMHTAMRPMTIFKQLDIYIYLMELFLHT